MKHVYALIIKFLMVALVIWIVLGYFTGLTLRDILYLSVPVTILAYLIGDLLILPASNNTIATISDIGLAFITIYAVNYLFIKKDLDLLEVLITSLVIGAGEWFFHKFVNRNVLIDSESK